MHVESIEIVNILLLGLVSKSCPVYYNMLNVAKKKLVNKNKHILSIQPNAMQVTSLKIQQVHRLLFVV